MGFNFNLQQDPGVGRRTEGRRKQHEVSGDLRAGGERIARHAACSLQCPTRAGTVILSFPRYSRVFLLSIRAVKKNSPNFFQFKTVDS